MNYALLAAVCSSVWWWQRQRQQQPVHQSSHAAAGRLLSNPWPVYPLLAFLDVQANFLVTSAYRYTSITSITLLDCFTVPGVMALSILVFKARFRAGHVAGSLLCVAGLSVLMLTDAASSTGGSNPLLGNTLVLAGACLYAVCNVAQERLLTSTSQWELLSMQGSWGTLIAGIQALVLERGVWLDGQWDGAAIGALFGFAASLFTFSLLIPLVLSWGGATVLNLSLLTSDLWAAGARAVFFGGFGGTGAAFASALALEASGIIAFAASGDTHAAPPDVTQAGKSALCNGGGDGDKGEGDHHVDESEQLLPKTTSSGSRGSSLEMVIAPV